MTEEYDQGGILPPGITVVRNNTGEDERVNPWVTCGGCKGHSTVRRGEFDWTCPDCDGDGGWEA